MARKIKNGRGDKECYKRVFNSMTIESACLAGRNNIKKLNDIRSHCHEIYTEEINKIVLSSDDNKRVIMADEIHTLFLRTYNLKKF